MRNFSRKRYFIVALTNGSGRVYGRFMDKIIEQLENAVLEHQSVTFDYKSETRTIAVEEVKQSSRGVNYIVGYDPEKDGTRRFHIHQMSNLVTA